MTIDLDSDLDALFSDTGLACAWTVSSTSYTATGLLDSPDQLDGLGTLSTEYSLTLKASAATSITRGQAITVAGVAYTVRQAPRKIDDGKLVRMELSKT